MPRKKNDTTPQPAVIDPIPDLGKGAEAYLHCLSVTMRRPSKGAIVRDVVFERDLGQDASAAAWPAQLAVYRPVVVAALAGGANPAVNASLKFDLELSEVSLSPVQGGKPAGPFWKGKGVLRWLRIQASEGVARVRWSIRCHAPAGHGNLFDELLASTVLVATTPAQAALPLGGPKEEKEEGPDLKVVSDLDDDEDLDEDLPEGA